MFYNNWFTTILYPIIDAFLKIKNEELSSSDFQDENIHFNDATDGK